MTTHKIYESKDSSLNISFEVKFTRLLLGFAYTEAPFSREVKMRMVTMHILCLCLCFVVFSNNVATPGEIRHEIEQRGRNINKKKRDK